MDQAVIKATKTSSLPHMPQLDALRAFAVLAVLLHHFINIKGLDFAFEGVKLFFVLSGFLITGILLRGRETMAVAGKTWSSVIKNFYFRRALRIFPLYYLLIFFGLILNLDPVRESLAWFLTYTLNIYMVNLGWYADNYAHFWSLAVEEQFYIVWPWIILFAPRKWLIPVTITFISVGPLFRFYGVTQDFGGLTTYISTPACLDTLGMGALLALVTHHGSKYSIDRFLRFFALPVGLISSILLIGRANDGAFLNLFTIFYDLALGLFFCWLINAAGQGFKGVAGAILESRPLTYIGKISYGIYIYHPFMPKLCTFIFSALGFEYPVNPFLTFMLPTLATFLIASVSFYAFEKPINDLKRYFSYREVPNVPAIPETA